MDRFDWLELTFDDNAALGRQIPIRTRPTDGPSFYRAARQMRASGHFKAASDFYEKAIGYDPHNYAAWVELVDTLVRGKHCEAAGAKSQEALDTYRKVKPLYAARALALAHTGKIREAYGYLDVAVDGADNAWYPRCVYAEILLRTSPDNRGEALNYLEEAANRAQHRWEPHFLGGWTLLDAGYAALAAGHFAEAAHYHPRAPIVWLCLGDCFRELRLFEQAMFYYQRVIEIEPAHALAIERQRVTAGKGFGLLRLFRKPDLYRRWNDEYAKLVEKWEPTIDDF